MEKNDAQTETNLLLQQIEEGTAINSSLKDPQNLTNEPISQTPPDLDLISVEAIGNIPELKGAQKQINVNAASPEGRSLPSERPPPIISTSSPSVMREKHMSAIEPQQFFFSARLGDTGSKTKKTGREEDDLMVRALQAMTHPVSGVPMKPRAYRFWRSQKCFIASVAVDWLVSHKFVLDRSKGLNLVERMRLCGFVRHTFDKEGEDPMNGRAFCDSTSDWFCFTEVVFHYINSLEPVPHLGPPITSPQRPNIDSSPTFSSPELQLEELDRASSPLLDPPKGNEAGNRSSQYSSLQSLLAISPSPSSPLPSSPISLASRSAIHIISESKHFTHEKKVVHQQIKKNERKKLESETENKKLVGKQARLSNEKFAGKKDSLQGDRNPFELLRDGLVFHILRYLTPQELCSLCQVCKRMKVISESGELWKPLYFKMFGSHKHDIARLIKNRRKSIFPSTKSASSPTTISSSSAPGFLTTDPSASSSSTLNTGPLLQNMNRNALQKRALSPTPKVSTPPSSSSSFPLNSREENRINISSTGIFLLQSHLGNSETRLNQFEVILASKKEAPYKEIFRFCYLQELKYTKPAFEWESLAEEEKFQISAGIGKIVNGLRKKENCGAILKGPHFFADLMHFTIVVTGPSQSGKSALIHRYFSRQDEGRGRPASCKGETVGARLLRKSCFLGGYHVNLLVWEVSGRERYRPLLPMYLKKAMAVMICYSPWDRYALQSARGLAVTLQQANPSTFFVLCPTMSDLAPSRSASSAETVNRKMEELTMPLPNLEIISTSAKDNVNVAKAFESMILRKIKALPMKDD